jgi:tRNA A37 methylthiotransferase MiaB
MLDRSLQADFMRDYLIALFSHPNVGGVMLWGFWEGRHWRPDAALFERDWTPRPVARAWMDLVHREWKTDLALTTDLIVGFPGETDDDFEQTLQVAAAAEYDSAYTFIYSPRPGTEAADMVDQFVDPAVVAERFDRLKVVLERSALAKHEARVGVVEEVVVEGPSRKDPSVLTGRTRQNKLVHFAADAPIRIGTYAEVLVTGAAPHFLRGELVGVTAVAVHRTRIPVASA